MLLYFLDLKKPKTTKVYDYLIFHSESDFQCFLTQRRVIIATPHISQPSPSVCVFPSQSRLAVNSVTAGDYSRPLRISNFINELDSGFRLLNLKNDPLRKRYDGLKYDVKKIEEVVYDLSIRGLSKEPDNAGDK